MCYIKHISDNLSIIDCNLTGDRDDEIIQELKEQAGGTRMRRFISTHPDQDHFGGIEKLDAEFPIWNFYVVQNQAVKADKTESFKYYCQLRDSDKAFYIYKDCSRKWMNQSDETRSTAGIHVLWPDASNEHFKQALADCDAGESYNNTSAVIRYSVQDLRVQLFKPGVRYFARLPAMMGSKHNRRLRKVDVVRNIFHEFRFEIA